MECEEICIKASISKVSFFLFFLFKLDIGMISAQQPHILSYIQFLAKGNNDDNSRLGLLLCFTIVWGCAEIFPLLQLLCPLGGNVAISWKCESEQVRVTIECRTSSVLTQGCVLFVLESLCSLAFAPGMIGCIISRRKKNLFSKNCFLPNMIFSLHLRNPKV